jgi:hypothetical protein
MRRTLPIMQDPALFHKTIIENGRIYRTSRLLPQLQIGNDFRASRNGQRFSIDTNKMEGLLVSLCNLDDRPPGLASQFIVDPRNEVFSDTIRYGELAFPYYMAQKQLFIDVWDGDTLLHLGSSYLDLRTGLRQGKAGVTVTEDIDIVWNQFADDVSHNGVRTANPSNGISNRPLATSGTGSKSLKLGSLHVSLTNIGRSNPDGALSKPSMKEASIVFDYHEHAKLRLNTTHEAHKVHFSETSLPTLTWNFTTCSSLR